MTDTQIDETQAYRLLDWMIREAVPVVLDIADTPQAAELRALPAITSIETAAAAHDILTNAYAAMSDAWDAIKYRGKVRPRTLATAAAPLATRHILRDSGALDAYKLVDDSPAWPAVKACGFRDTDGASGGFGRLVGTAANVAAARAAMNAIEGLAQPADAQQAKAVVAEVAALVTERLRAAVAEVLG